MRPTRRRRRLVVVVLPLLLLGAAAGTAAVLLLGGGLSPAKPGPLTVGSDAVLTVTPAAAGCNTSFVFDATGSLSGAGTLVYRWEQSDGSRTPDIRQAITSDQGGFHFVQAWRLQGTQVLDGTMSLHILQPVDRSISRPFHYHCP